MAALKAKGIDAAAFAADASDPSALRSAVEKARATLDPATIASNFWDLYTARGEVRARVS